jgi:hypothetical protein
VTVAAIVILAVWAVGIVAFAWTTPKFVDSQPMARLMFGLRPRLVGVLLATVIVMWPGTLGAALLIRVTEKRRQP